MNNKELIETLGNILENFSCQYIRINPIKNIIRVELKIDDVWKECVIRSAQDLIKLDRTT